MALSLVDQMGENFYLAFLRCCFLFLVQVNVETFTKITRKKTSVGNDCSL